MLVKADVQTKHWVQVVNGRSSFIGRVDWQDMAPEEKDRAIIECYDLGIRSDLEIARLLRAKGKDGGFSRSAVGGHIHRRRRLFPEWLLNARRITIRVSRSQTSNAARSSGKNTRPRGKSDWSRQKANPEKTQDESLSRSKIQTLIEAPVVIERSIGYCTKLVKYGDEMCGESTGDPALKRCLAHRGM